ncbi:MAG TPA: DUF4185 domain-containing protein [Mycobacterium sp.]|nr:DUF4185 domain-containing protein [Mycobacterium sp.]
MPAAGLIVAQAISPVFADPPAPFPQPILFPLAEGQVFRIGPVAGTGTPTGDYDIGATDLCEFVDFPSEMLQVCGDSFAGQGVGFGPWHSPIALRVDRESVDQPDGVRYTGVIGVAQPLLADPTPTGYTQLPAGVVSINRANYLMVTTAAHLVPYSSRLVKAEPAQGRWQTIAGSARPASYQQSRQSQISGYYDPVPTADSPTGWVYIVADNFGRTEPAVLYRVTPDAFGDRSAWQGWAAGPGGGWGKTPTPLWDGQVGEMSVRQIDGKTVLSYFNASTWNMEVRVADDPTSLGAAPVTMVVQHAEQWPEPAEALPWVFDNQLAQPYGGYLSPGSTLDELRVFVSQWRTDPREREPYRVIQFAVNPFKP